MIVFAVSAILPMQSAQAQVTIGGLAPNDAVCTGAGGVLNSQFIAFDPDACDAGVVSGTSNGTVTATTAAGSTSIDGPTIVSTTPTGTTTISGGFVTAEGTVSSNIVSASVGNITTINSTTIANSGNIQTNTLNVTGASTTTGITNTGNLVNTGDVKTTTLNVTGASTTTGITNTGNIQTDTLQTTGNAGVGGNLGVTGTSTFTGAATFNGGATVNQSFKVGPGSTVSMGNNVVHDVAAPVAATDAANKAYVDQGINSAFKKIEENTEGIAIAMSLGGLTMPESKTFALGANLGFYGGKEAVSAQTAIRLDENVTLNGGVGVGLDSSQVGGHVGVMTAW